MTTLFIGTYTRDTDSSGIYRCEWDAEHDRFNNLRLAAQADNPSFLIAHADCVFAVHETADFDGARQGALAQYQVSGAELVEISLLGTGGADPCHLAADPTGIAVANYSGASVALFALAGTRLTGPVNLVRFDGRGPHRRQAAAHPHGVYFADGEVLVPDLGLDRIHRLDRATGRVTGAWSVMPGSGPRQLALGSDRHSSSINQHGVSSGRRAYLLNELANRIDLLHAGSVAQSIGTLPPSEANTGSTSSMAGAIALTPDGRYVIASNRGVDSLACFAVDPETGRLGRPSIIPCDPHPRHFCIVGNRALVASRDAGTLTAFALSPTDGLGAAVATCACPAPVCVLAMPAGTASISPAQRANAPLRSG